MLFSHHFQENKDGSFDVITQAVVKKYLDNLALCQYIRYQRIVLPCVGLC